MSDTPETNALTAGCTFGPFVEAIAEKCRELEIQRNMLRKALADVLDENRRLFRTNYPTNAAAYQLLKATAAKGEVQP